MGLSKEGAIQLVGTYLTRNLNVANLIDGWPQGSYGTSDEAVWSVIVPSDHPRLGSDRYIVISKMTGEIVADDLVGE